MCDYEAEYYDYEEGGLVLYKCPHEPSKPRCMFHDGSSYKSRPDDVRNEFYKMVEDAIQNDQPLYCIGFNLPDITVMGKKFTKPVYFPYSTFQQQAIFSFAKFQQQAYFSRATFQQQADFSFAKFQQQVYFSNATFQQQVYFLGATFQQEANFLIATFQKADFSGAIFQQADFLSVTFQQEADFLYADFIGEVEFINTTFSNEDRTNKHIPIRFDYSTFRSRVRFIGDSNEPLDLSNVSFKGVNLDNVEFHNVRWREDKVLWFLPFIKRNIIADELFMDELKNYQEVSRIYNQLRKNYEMHLHFTEASHFFIGEMEAIRRSLWSKGIGGKLASIPYLLYKYIALYGESVFLPLVFWTPVIIIGFAVWRILVSNCYDPQCMIDRVIDSIAAYFQVPRNALQQDIIERILAIPILGSAFIALRRRFERRK
jgi:uncharacterized protein YjbI with pentapeptide repeats